ncbi:hypothetical protein KUCAC02_029195 [Chaenocephalus aceratus]|uniref:Uncharacterized protein n=1 Tax=Chaenocephalus aceratus TaxID=36190 RepID=A0ACB9X5B9_CHAAC|nr:hypothetical protein KUCAC02_029195 [Chaenocephalus aceratus]
MEITTAEYVTNYEYYDEMRLPVTSQSGSHLTPSSRALHCSSSSWACQVTAWSSSLSGDPKSKRPCCRSEGCALEGLCWRPWGAIWFLSGVLAVPTLLFRTTVNDALNSNRTTCAMDFSLVTMNQRHDYLWIAGAQPLLLCLGFLLPFWHDHLLLLIGCTVTRTSTTCARRTREEEEAAEDYHHTAPAASCASCCSLIPTPPAWLRQQLPQPIPVRLLDLRFRSQCLCLFNLKKAMHGHMSSMSSTLSAQTLKSEIQSLATKV